MAMATVYLKSRNQRACGEGSCVPFGTCYFPDFMLKSREARRSWGSVWFLSLKRERSRLEMMHRLTTGSRRGAGLSHCSTSCLRRPHSVGSSPSPRPACHQGPPLMHWSRHGNGYIRATLMRPEVIASGGRSGMLRVIRAREKHLGWRGRTPRRMGVGKV